MKLSDEELVARSKALFDESVDELDAATLSRLNRGRQAALDTAGRGRSPWLLWAPASGVAAAAVIAVVMVAGPDPAAIEAPAGDLEILLGEESIEMLEELEFYAWLESSDLDGNGDS